MQRLGQHFLKSQAILKKIAAAASTYPVKNILEIGPGHGELTQFLISGGRGVVAVEKDPSLAAKLMEKKISGLKIVEGDVRELLRELTKPWKRKSYVITGNIPYYLTGKLLRIISELSSKPTACVFLLQREVAERICAEPPHMNRLAAATQFWSRPKILFLVPRESFDPPPEVASAVVSLETRPDTEKSLEEAYFRVLRALFSQPRKTIANNVRTLYPKKLKFDGVLEKIVSRTKINPKLRPQDLNINQIISLAKTLQSL